MDIVRQTLLCSYFNQGVCEYHKEENELIAAEAVSGQLCPVCSGV